MIEANVRVRVRVRVMEVDFRVHRHHDLSRNHTPDRSINATGMSSSEP